MEANRHRSLAVWDLSRLVRNREVSDPPLFVVPGVSGKVPGGVEGRLLRGIATMPIIADWSRIQFWRGKPADAGSVEQKYFHKVRGRAVPAVWSRSTSTRYGDVRGAGSCGMFVGRRYVVGIK